MVSYKVAKQQEEWITKLDVEWDREKKRSLELDIINQGLLAKLIQLEIQEE